MSACPSCGSPMSRGTRYEADRTVAVLICWECGEETPSLYGRPRTMRDFDTGRWSRHWHNGRRLGERPVLTRRAS